MAVQVSVQMTLAAEKSCFFGFARYIGCFDPKKAQIYIFLRQIQLFGGKKFEFNVTAQFYVDFIDFC